MSSVTLIPTLPAAGDAKAKHPSGVWVGGATELMVKAGAALWLDLSRCEDLTTLKLVQGSVHLGAAVPLAALAGHGELKKSFPLLVAASLHTATPQTRQQATVAGALCQESRCPYLRQQEDACAPTQDTACRAQGDEGFPFAIIDNESCAALHASTLGLAFLVLEARMQVQMFESAGVETHMWSMEQFFNFDVKVKHKNNALPPGALITTIHLNEDNQGNTQHYFRLSSRKMAEWAEIEVALNAQVSGGVIQKLRLGVGAVGRRPMLLKNLESAAVGKTFVELAQRDMVMAHLPEFTPLPGQEHRREALIRSLQAAFQEVIK